MPRKNRVVGKPYMQRHAFGFFVMWNRKGRKECMGRFRTEESAQRCIDMMNEEIEKKENLPVLDTPPPAC